MQTADVLSSPPPPTSWWGPYACLLLGFAGGAVVQKLGTDGGRPLMGIVAMASLSFVTFFLAWRSARARGLL